MTAKATRQEVYAALDSERAYQQSKWNPDVSTSGGEHSLEDYSVYIRVYVRKLEEALTLEPDPAKRMRNGLDVMRKIGGLAVRAMEQHGAPRREGF